MNPNLSDRLLSLMRSLSRTDSPTKKLWDGSNAVPHSYHKSIKQQQNEGKKEKAKPSLYMRRDRQAKEKVRYE